MLTDFGRLLRRTSEKPSKVCIERHITQWLICSANVLTATLKTTSGRKDYINNGTKNSTLTSGENPNWKLIRPLTT